MSGVSIIIFLTVWLDLSPVSYESGLWGFAPHKLINRYAVFTLPPEMLKFYKYHIHYISEQAVAADHRRYVLPDEGPRHYIDLDYYGTAVPRQWETFLSMFPADSIQDHGVLPWNLYLLKFRLTEAFRKGDLRNILRLSADGGHYLADAHVPLHTTSNYNGQFTGQHGIHGFWETRIPELLITEFDLWVGGAEYQHNWYQTLWGIVLSSHNAVDSVLVSEYELTKNFPSDQKYSFEVRLNRFRKVYSMSFCRAYHQMLDKQVERKFRAAIRAVGNFWYTCWVDAGQPDLSRMLSTLEPDYYDYQQFADSLWLKQHQIRSQ
ncbi:MAG: hypothetical protein DHS20C17_09670 [Cyclobacteriaceae bacterium]|nr:MAG: hypothetical protein DHS20C17_09670 [Cyclobacteriaceae bacterium]